MKYRREIDGLRSVAVIPVLLFHAGFEWFSGGYVGVDVFFVISGYLITSIILAEKAANTFTIAGFYERRARRILPALFLVVIASLPFAWFWMLPHQLKDFSQSIVAVCLFVSNILFFGEGGYFAPAAELKPLLHTWSLAVEEQFYVIFPVLMVVLWRCGRRLIAVVVVTIAILSLAAAQFGGNVSVDGSGFEETWKWFAQPAWASFYLATGRAWELMIGSLAALYLSSRGSSPIRASEIGSIAGLLLILYSIVAFDGNTPFPSVYTLVPTLGTVLIVLFASQQTFVGRLLSLPVLVGIGLISYSAYLWHQPLFAFARIRLLDVPGAGVYLALIAAAFVLAYLSWKYVEVPFRRRSNFSAAQVFAFALLVSAALVGVGLAGHVGDGFPQRLSAQARMVLSYRDDRGSLRDSCDAGTGAYIPPAERCVVGAQETAPTIAVVGDSHARELAYFLGQAASATNLGVKVLVYSSCPPIMGAYRVATSQDTCPQNNRDVVNYLRESESISHIVLVARWTLYLEVDRFDNGEGGKEHGGPFFMAPVGIAPAAVDRELVRQSMGDLLYASVEHFLDTGKDVILVYPIPEVGWNVPEYLARKALFGTPSDSPLSTSHARYQERNAYTIAILDSLGERPGLRRIKPEHIFCDTDIPKRCAAEGNGVPLYFDDDHLNSIGSAPIVEQILGLILQQDQ